MSHLKKLFFLIVLLFFSTVISAQVESIGTPFVKNYQRSEYLAGSQTWDIQQGINGMMYFANNDGLLEFDGSHWNIYSLPNRSILRSIESSNDGLLYAGGFNEIGYFTIGGMGGAVFTSILNLLPEELRDFGEVWKIYIHPDGVIFQTYNQLIIYKDDTVNVIEAPSVFHFSFMVNNEYYVNDMEIGLLRYAMGELYPLSGTEVLKGKEIWGMLPVDNKLLIATASDGTYIYNGNSLEAISSNSTSFLKKNQIYSTLLLESNKLAFGTIQDGILICDKAGNPLHHFSKEDGLQNNTILSICLDYLGNIWLGTDHGIDYVEINSPLSQISHNYGVSTGYAAFIKNDRIYLGTNQGLFTQKYNCDSLVCANNEKMVLIEETKGQVWSLTDINGTLFCGHNNGAYIIDDTTAKKICNIPGGWVFLAVPNNPNKIIGGTYTGLVIYSNESGDWKFQKQLDGFIESSRKMDFDVDGSLWVTHGYKGIYHVFFNDSYDSIIEIDFFNSNNINLPEQVNVLAKVDNTIVFPSNKGILQYSPKENDFKINKKINDLFDGEFVRTIIKDNEGNLWYFKNNAVGVLRHHEDGNYTNISIPFKELEGMFVSNFEFVYPYDNKNVFFGTENGFVHYNPSLYKNYDYEFLTFLESMNAFNPDSVFFKDEQSDIVLDFVNNSVEFVYSANDFENPDKILYSTYLEKNDKGWSKWQPGNSRTYTNLFEGNYTFRVKSKNIYGTVSNGQSMTFKVKPPFLRSIVAYTLYVIVFLIFILLVMLAIRRRFVRAKIRSEQKQHELFRKKEEKLQRENLESEKEVIRMRNEKLREGIKLKDKELANSTMQMLHKNEMLITLRDELKKLANLFGSDSHQHDVIRLVRGINKEIDNEKQWNVFETHFESVHEEFLKRIKTAYPNLTPRELKLCAYLRMNISSKEISVLMNISTRGVEISRYRLRKKLGIARETNLTDFILSF